jgi:hypothetical protein
MLDYISTITLPHNGDCTLIGIGSDFTIYTEEIYTDEAWIAQHAVQIDGKFVASVDEQYGETAEVTPLVLPDDLVRAQPGWHTIKALNFAGPRHRGMRESDRITDILQPLTLMEKMSLVKRLALPIAPPALLGLAESYVLAEAELQRPYLYVVCRRVRIAYALPAVQMDAAQHPYDYDTMVVYAAHLVDRRAEIPGLPDETLPGIDLYRPMDCIISQGYLFVADGGGEIQNNRIHIWRIQL